MNLFDQFATDESIEQAGIFIETGEVDTPDGKKKTRFKICRAGGANDTFNKALEKAIAPYRRLLQADKADPKVIEDVYIKVFVKTVLLGWENVYGRDNVEIPFSKENALNLLTELKELYKHLKACSEDFTLFKEVIREEDAGNFGAS